MFRFVVSVFVFFCFTNSVFSQESEKKKTTAQIRKDAREKMGRTQELIFCKGFKVKVVGHTYTISCVDNAAENALREFIGRRR